MDLGERLGPEEHLLLLRRRHEHEPGHDILAAHAPPHVRARVEARRHPLAARLLRVLPPDPLDLALDVRERVEGYVLDGVLDAVLLEPEAPAREQDVGLARGGQVGDAVADEDDERDRAVLAHQLGLPPRLRDRQRLVVAQLRVVAPDRLPRRPVRRDLRLVRHDLDVRRRLLAQERVQHSPQHGLEARRDHVEGDLVRDAELVELLEGRVDLQRLLHHPEAVLEGHVERPPHFL